MSDKLVKQILRLCEKQYRKGFQHGAHQAVRLGGHGEADRFRSAGMAKDYNHHVTQDGLNMSDGLYAQAMSAECAMPDMNELRSILDEYADRVF